ncbi:MAG: 6-pyruvoyl-tetrahydropterin synthase-related protein [Chthoniobacter sp.]|nr:6-pyruvoyl-tetrahydropterin synthase-related protein [Chthoniobacter sp.]
MKLLESDAPQPCETPPSAPRHSSQGGRTTLLHFIILLLVAVVATRVMWGPAMLAGHSAWFDLARMVEFDAAIRAGDYFPTWSPDLYSGYGSPIFQFYAPLAYYIAEVPVLAGLDYPTALKATQLLALFASGLAMYRLAATYFSGWSACLGGIFYMLAPYRLVDMFIRHALAEHCAFVWLPLIIWGTERFLSKSSRAGLATGVLAIAALILTHNIMALIGLPVCLTAGWILATPKRGVVSLAAAGTIAVLGVGLAAFFWWPAMSGRPLTQSEVSLTGGYFDFHRHFVEAWQFLDLHWKFGVSAGQPDERMPVQIGLPHLFAGLGAVVMVLGRWQGDGETGRRRKQWSLIGAAVMAVGVFMCSRLSQGLWEILSLVKYVQFPWRFLGLVALGAGMCATALADRFAAAGERAATIATMAGLFVIMTAYFPYYSQARFLAVDARTRSLVNLAPSEVDTLQAAGVLIPLGQTITSAELRAMHERATSSDDFLPIAVTEKPAEPPTQLVQATGGQVLESTRLRQNHYRSHLQMSAPGQAALAQFWFPGWQATVDDLPAKTVPGGPQAIVSCDVPAGNHIVEFSYHSLPQRRTGIILSLLAAALTACALIGAPLWRRPTEGHSA